MLSTHSTAPTALQTKNRRRSIRVDAGDHRDVGAHERHEPADHQGLVAVLVEERAGLVEVLPLEHPAVALVERRPDPAADLVADHVAGERRRSRARTSATIRLTTSPPGTIEMSPRAMNRPTANSRVSPGRNGKNSPHSTTMISRLTQKNDGAELVEQPLGVHPVDAEQHRVQACHAARVSGGT